MHTKDSEPQTFLGLTGHMDLMTSQYGGITTIMNIEWLISAGNRVSYEFNLIGPR